MSNPTYTARPAEALGSDALAELALDMRWSFNHAADAIWQQLDPVLWSLTHNPWFVLQTVSRERLEAVTADPGFRQVVETLVQDKRDALESPGWFQRTHPHTRLTSVAYFCMEFMLSEALPIYSGGLGNVAGDQLKTASNLGVPVIGIGLLYQQGYFRQELDSQGRQQAMYPFNDPGQLPMRPLREPNGEWLRFSIAFPGSALWVRAWHVQIGRVQLYLLDTNDPANAPTHRGITSELFGGDAELRLKQEIVLGIGGWRVLRALGVAPEVCHLNEGHPAFVVLERARDWMVANGQTFECALTVTRAGNLFTTHTPVDAGFDRFPAQLIARYLATYAEQDLGIPFDDLLALGQRTGGDRSDPFNMAYLAIRGSGSVNGVSQLHGTVGRRLFQPLFPRWPEADVPVTSVTNGVHMPTWDSVEADRLWERTCGKDRWRRPLEDTERDFAAVTDADLWQLRRTARTALVQYVRGLVGLQRAERGASPADVSAAETLFDPEALTIGFARRFASYKRPNLLLHDPDRLARILTNGQRPVQLLVAGKAHPNDPAGQALVEQWVAFIRRPDVNGRATFLADYDMLMAEHLVQGIDLWISTPRRPWEACGTSGMKVLVNGGLNLSELDGWWAEAYSPEVGWAIGDGHDRGDDPAWDSIEADAAYALLEGEIVESFYARDPAGIPTDWVMRMRTSMARLTPTFSSGRSVREYTEGHYLPAAARYCDRAADGGLRAAELLTRRKALEQAWDTAAFSDLDIRSEGDRHIFDVEVDLGSLDPEHVQVELYADGQQGSAAFRQPMTRRGRVPGRGHRFRYETNAPAIRPPGDFTPRLVACLPGAVPVLEAPLILWFEGPR